MDQPVPVTADTTVGTMTATRAVGNDGPRPCDDPAIDQNWVIDQNWEAYGAAEHALWRALFHRQAALLKNRAAPEFLAGIETLRVSADRIPDFRRLNEVLDRATGWQIVAVPGLVPDPIFFAHLAHRRFPSTRFLRRPEQMDYLEEPDIFHDVFGHVPLLVNPVFANYMAAYGRNGLEALGQGNLHRLARLYWYTVEFGLIRLPEGLRIYGAGILSSKGESIFCLDDPAPNRVAFDLHRVMRTRYRIDDFQETYFVIDSFEHLFAVTQGDLGPSYGLLSALPDLAPGELAAGDVVIKRGTGRRS